jgi:hypothetical protein
MVRPIPQAQIKAAPLALGVPAPPQPRDPEGYQVPIQVGLIRGPILVFQHQTGERVFPEKGPGLQVQGKLGMESVHAVAPLDEDAVPVFEYEFLAGGVDIPKGAGGE